MCQLLGFCARFPSVLQLSFNHFVRAASLENPDGWGLAFYNGKDAHVLREPEPATDSAFARYLAEHGIHSRLVLSHVRKATVGEIALHNTHPFVRELNGCLHSFVFNGDVDAVLRVLPPPQRFQPIGDTDAEYAFCCLLEQLAEQASNDHEQRAQTLHAFGCMLAELGPSNFIYSDSDALYAFASRRTQDNGELAAPGLYALHRRCQASPATGQNISNGVQICHSQAEQHVSLIASRPLCADEGWQGFAENELQIFRAGYLSQRLS